MGQTELTVTICGKNGYISRYNKTYPGFDRLVSYDYYGLNGDFNDMNQQMLYVQRYFGIEEPQQIIHFVVDYGDSIKNDKTASAYSESCAEYFSSNYQMYYYTHQDIQSLRYHAHVLVNSVSCVNGELFNTSIESMNRFCEYLCGLFEIPVKLL